jgi:hypothetical protein
MKFHPSLRLLSVVVAFGLPVTRVCAQVQQLDVGVRATLANKPPGWTASAGQTQQGRNYGIFLVQMISSEDKIVKPVDAHALMDLVYQELDAHGFRRVGKGVKPDILITVQYGRAWLRNPYFGDAQSAAGGATTVGGMGSKVNAAQPMQIQSLDMANADKLMRLRENGVEAKAQKAQFEKLCIKVTAWQYFTDPKARARQLWATIMVVDDPDHRDLNAVAAKMLEAGAPYFGREIAEEEIDVYKPIPDGRVNVGAPEVVESALKK